MHTRERERQKGEAALLNGEGPNKKTFNIHSILICRALNGISLKE